MPSDVPKFKVGNHNTPCQALKDDFTASPHNHYPLIPLFPLYVRMHTISSRKPVLNGGLWPYESSLYLRASWLLSQCLIGRVKTPGKVTPTRLVQTFMFFATVLYMHLTIEDGSLISYDTYVHKRENILAQASHRKSSMRKPRQ